MVARSLVLGATLGGALLFACAPPAAGDAGAAGRSDDVGARAREGFAEADRVLGPNRESTFAKLRERIESVQVISEAGLARLDLRWDDGSAYAAARARFVSAKTNLDVFYALRALERSLHDAHARLELDDSFTQPSGVLALPLEVDVEYEDDDPRYVIGSGEHRGARIVSVDGEPIATIERELVTWVIGSSPEAWRASVAHWLTRRPVTELPAPDPGTRTEIGIVERDGSESKLTLTWEDASTRTSSGNDRCTSERAPNPDYAGREPELVGNKLCVYAGPDAATKIVRWYSFEYGEADDFRREYEALFRHVFEGKVRKVLFDVRENLGGVFDPTVVSAFTTSPVRQLATEVVFKPGLRATPTLLDQAEGMASHVTQAKAFLRANPHATKSPRLPFFCKDDCTAAQMTLPRPQSPMVAEVAILTGPDCVSSCDNFVAMMKDAGVARLVGMPAAGGDSPVRLPLPLELADGTRFSLVVTVAVNRRPSGEVLEGAPDSPDVPLFPSASTRGRYLDAAIRAVGF